MAQLGPQHFCEEKFAFLMQETFNRMTKKCEKQKFQLL